MNGLIQHLLVQTKPYFGPTGKYSPQVTYTYYIGDHGPFSDTYDEGQDTPDVVQAAMLARVNKLKAVGALPADA